MNPLRTNTERMQFCDNYFQSVGSTVLFKSEDYREYLLPLETDKELTDRPFFWMWAEKTGQPIQPTTLRLAFSMGARDRENERLKQEALAAIENKPLSPVERMFFRPPQAELIDNGCFRLGKIFQSVDLHGKFASVMSAHGSTTEKVVPWLCMNGTISYCCDSIEQHWFSSSICLQSGQIIDDFYSKIRKLVFHASTPDEILTNATWNIQDAIQHLKEHVEQAAKRRPTDWAANASQRLFEEMKRLELYYQSILPDVKEDEHRLVSAELARKKTNLQSLHEPKIILEWKQIALIGLPVK